MLRILEWVVEHLIRPRWIVNDNDEFGVRILGVNCYYYKWESPLIYHGHLHDNGDPMGWRLAKKREFGECILAPYGYDGMLRLRNR